MPTWMRWPAAHTGRRAFPIAFGLGSLMLAATLSGSALDAASSEPPVPRPIISALLQLAAKAQEMGNAVQAAQVYSQAATRARELEDVAGESKALDALGRLHLNTGKYAESLEALKRAVTLHFQTGNLKGAGSSLINAGLAADQLGRIQERDSLYQKALSTAREAKEPRTETYVLINIGSGHMERRDYQQAISTYAAALAIREQLGDTDGVMQVVLLLSSAYHAADMFEASERQARRALESARARDKRPLEGQALIRLGMVMHQRGDFPGSVETLVHGLRLVAGGEKDPLEPAAWFSLAEAYDHLGEARKSLEAVETARRLQRERGGTGIEAAALIRLARQVYLTGGQTETALELLRQALEVNRQTADEGTDAHVRLLMGSLYAREGRSAEGIALIRGAVDAFRRLGDSANLIGGLVSLSRVYGDLRQIQPGLEALREAEELTRTANTPLRGAILNEMGELYLNLEQPSTALEYLAEALPVVRQLGQLDHQAVILHNTALAEQALGRKSGARAHLLEAVRLRERLYAGYGGLDETGSQFLKSRLQSHYELVNVLVGEDDYRAAFGWAQRTKSRLLLDVAVGGRLDIYDSVTDAERAELLALRVKADGLNAAMIAEGARNVEGSKARYEARQLELRKTEDEMRRFTDILYARHPDLRRRNPATTITAAQAAAILPDDTLLLEYLVPIHYAGRADEARIFCVWREKGAAQIQHIEIAAGSDELGRMAGELKESYTDPLADYAPLSREVSRRLLAPVARFFAGKKRLIICPDGPLWDVPFHALPVPEDAGLKPGFLCERFEVDYAYSATALRLALLSHRANPTRQAGSVLAMANPKFGSARRFGDIPEAPGQRPLEPPTRPLEPPIRPIAPPTRPLAKPTRPIAPPTRRVAKPKRPIEPPSRPLAPPTRRLAKPRRPIDPPSRPLEPPTRALVQSLRAMPAFRDGGIVELQGTEREADLLRRGYPGSAIYTGMRAQESTFKREAPRYRYLHLATHGFYNDASPLLSCLLLAEPLGGSEDGFLTAREIYSLPLTAELAVLSACNSGRGEHRTGEGVVGLTWALFAAGVPTQVVSQWAVDDASTAFLMERFYAGLKRGRPKGEALRSASLALLRGADRKHRHPYYWAPFVLMGDWR